MKKIYTKIISPGYALGDDGGILSQMEIMIIYR